MDLQEPPYPKVDSITMCHSLYKYGPITSKDGFLNIACINLVEGIHFKPKSTKWSDLTDYGRQVHDLFMNFAAHAHGLREPLYKKGISLVPTEGFPAHVDYEGLFSPEEGFQTQRLVGYRLVLRCKARKLPPKKVPGGQRKRKPRPKPKKTTTTETNASGFILDEAEEADDESGSGEGQPQDKSTNVTTSMFVLSKQTRNTNIENRIPDDRTFVEETEDRSNNDQSLLDQVIETLAVLIDAYDAEFNFVSNAYNNLTDKKISQIFNKKSKKWIPTYNFLSQKLSEQYEVLFGDFYFNRELQRRSGRSITNLSHEDLIKTFEDKVTIPHSEKASSKLEVLAKSLSFRNALVYHCASQDKIVSRQHLDITRYFPEQYEQTGIVPPLYNPEFKYIPTRAVTTRTTPFVPPIRSQRKRARSETRTQRKNKKARLEEASASPAPLMDDDDLVDMDIELEAPPVRRSKIPSPHELISDLDLSDVSDDIMDFGDDDVPAPTQATLPPLSTELRQSDQDLDAYVKELDKFAPDWFVGRMPSTWTNTVPLDDGQHLWTLNGEYAFPEIMYDKPLPVPMGWLSHKVVDLYTDSDEFFNEVLKSINERVLEPGFDVDEFGDPVLQLGYLTESQFTEEVNWLKACAKQELSRQRQQFLNPNAPYPGLLSRWPDLPVKELRAPSHKDISTAVVSEMVSEPTHELTNGHNYNRRFLEDRRVVGDPSLALATECGRRNGKTEYLHHLEHDTILRHRMLSIDYFRQLKAEYDGDETNPEYLATLNLLMKQRGREIISSYYNSPNANTGAMTRRLGMSYILASPDTLLPVATGDIPLTQQCLVYVQNLITGAFNVVGAGTRLTMLSLTTIWESTAHVELGSTKLKLNILLTGDAQSGKSYAENVATQMSVPGSTINVTVMSKHGLTTENPLAEITYIQEELQTAGFMGQTGKNAKQGDPDTNAIWKNILTRSEVTTLTCNLEKSESESSADDSDDFGPDADPTRGGGRGGRRRPKKRGPKKRKQTHRRTAISRALASINMLGAFNWPKSLIDPAMRTRLGIIATSKVCTAGGDRDGSGPLDVAGLDKLHPTEFQLEAIRRMHLLHAYVVQLDQLIKGGALPQGVETSVAEVLLSKAFAIAEQHDVPHTYPRNHERIILAATVICKLDAAYYALASPHAHLYYKEHPNVSPWSATAMVDLAFPRLYITIDHLVYALSILESLFTNEYEYFVVMTFVRNTLNAFNGNRKHPRDAQDNPDPRFFCATGNNDFDLMLRVPGDLGDICKFTLSNETIRDTIINPGDKDGKFSLMESKFRYELNEATGELTKYPNPVPGEKVKPVEILRNVGVAGQGGKKVELRMSVEFLESRYGIKLAKEGPDDTVPLTTDEEILKLLRPERFSTKESAKTISEKLREINHNAHPMFWALGTVLSNMTLRIPRRVTRKNPLTKEERALANKNQGKHYFLTLFNPRSIDYAVYHGNSNKVKDVYSVSFFSVMQYYGVKFNPDNKECLATQNHLLPSITATKLFGDIYDKNRAKVEAVVYDGDLDHVSSVHRMVSLGVPYDAIMNPLINENVDVLEQEHVYYNGQGVWTYPPLTDILNQTLLRRNQDVLAPPTKIDYPCDDIRNIIEKRKLIRSSAKSQTYSAHTSYLDIDPKIGILLERTRVVQESLQNVDSSQFTGTQPLRHPSPPRSPPSNALKRVIASRNQQSRRSPRFADDEI